MRVLLDDNGRYTARAGVARYLDGLLGGFAELGAPDVDVAPLAWRVDNLGWAQPARMVKTAYRELLWPRLVARRALRRAGADLYHSTGPVLVPLPDGVREVHTLYDVAVVRQPERFRRWHRLSAERLVRRLHEKARIVCISRFTADEAMALTGLPASRFDVVHLGVSLSAAAARPPAYAVPERFFLFVGSLEPGKNLALLREVYALARSRGERLPPLLVVGARWQGLPGEGGPPPDWHYLGREPDETLAWLYQRALALVFPSRYEGFGLPIAEAMSLGCPVLCAPVASLPEVGGEAVSYAPLEPDRWLAAMHRLADDDAWRADLAARGLARAPRFTWRRCAEETAAVYRDVLR